MESRRGSQRVAIAKQLLDGGRPYASGCTDFVCEVLGVAWEDARSLLGDASTFVGKGNEYEGLAPGDVAGWLGTKVDHVAIFVGEPGLQFIDVAKPGARPRKVAKGYGTKRLNKSSKY